MYVVLRNGGKKQDLVLKGSITGQDSMNIVSLVEENLNDQIKRVVINLEECELLTSDVLNSICLLQRTLEENSIAVVLSNVIDINKQIYDRLHLRNILPIVEESR
ncbi:hypothetical protein J7K50_00190 [bacterium]|nr:hypothetical protein [bacterium]